MRDSQMLARYDERILDPVLRAAYGEGGYFNVGFWADRPGSLHLAAQALVDRVIDAHPTPLEGDVLDVGCGLGDSTARVHERLERGRVRGVNISHAQLERCRRRFPYLEFVHADAARLALGPVDHVVSVEAAFHFETRRSFLTHVRRDLRPCGTLRLADALFPIDWAGAWTVPAENTLAGPAAYSDLLAELGFVRARVSDITERTWRPWVKAMMTELPARDDDPEVRAWVEVLPLLAELPVRYLVVCAEAPEDT